MALVIKWPIRRDSSDYKCHTKLRRPIFCDNDREFYLREICSQLHSNEIINIRSLLVDPKYTHMRNTAYSMNEQKVLLFDAMQRKRVYQLQVHQYADANKPWTCAQSIMFLPQLFATDVGARYSKPEDTTRVIEKDEVSGIITVHSSSPRYIPHDLNIEGPEFKVLNYETIGIFPAYAQGYATALDGKGYRNVVTFGPLTQLFSRPPWYGNYVIIDFNIGRNMVCDWAVVGDLDYRYLWFLYRFTTTTKIDPERKIKLRDDCVEQMKASALAFGYTEEQIRGMVRYG